MLEKGWWDVTTSATLWRRGEVNGLVAEILRELHKVPNVVVVLAVAFGAMSPEAVEEVAVEIGLEGGEIAEVEYGFRDVSDGKLESTPGVGGTFRLVPLHRVEQNPRGTFQIGCELG